jgi:hypothetical protein
MHTAYERILNQYLVAHTESWCNMIACFLKKLPALDEINQDWVLGFLSKYSNSIRCLRDNRTSIVEPARDEFLLRFTTL